MKKISFLIILSTIWFSSLAQINDVIVTNPVPSTGISVNKQSQRHANATFYRTLYMPKWTSFDLRGGKDSVGAILFNTSINKMGVYRGGGAWDTVAYLSNIPVSNNLFTRTGTIIRPTTANNSISVSTGSGASITGITTSNIVSSRGIWGQATNGRAIDGTATTGVGGNFYSGSGRAVYGNTATGMAGDFQGGTGIGVNSFGSQYGVNSVSDVGIGVRAISTSGTGLVVDKLSSTGNIATFTQGSNVVTITNDAKIEANGLTLKNIPTTETNPTQILTRDAVSGDIKNIDLKRISNPFYGETWYCLGDSFTAMNIYQPYLTSRLGVAITSDGIGGTCVAVGCSITPSFVERMPTAIAAGKDRIVMVTWNNDRGAPVPIGTPSSTNSSTYYGALNNIATMAAAANQKMIWVTAGQAGTTRSIYVTQKQYNDVMIEVANKYGIPVINTFDGSGLSYETNSVNTVDGIHLNAVGKPIFGNFLTSSILSQVTNVPSFSQQQASQLFVDLTTSQTIGGYKTFSDAMLINSTSDVSVPTSASFIRMSNYFSPNMTSGQVSLNQIGKESSNGNSTNIGFGYEGFSSVNNFGFLGFNGVATPNIKWINDGSTQVLGTLRINNLTTGIAQIGSTGIVSSSSALPDGTTAATQIVSDNTVKIATTAHVKSVVASGQTIGANTTGKATGTTLQDVATAGNNIDKPNSMSYPSLGVRGTEHMYITQNGVNGYGLQLGVSNDGNGWLQAMDYINPTPYNIILNPAGGNVAVGKTTANAKLDVNGSIRASANDGNANTVVRNSDLANGTIQNQNAGAQSSSNFWISGSGLANRLEADKIVAYTNLKTGAFSTGYGNFSSNFTVTSSLHSFFVNTSGGSVTGTLPDATTFDNIGRIVVIKKVDSSSNTITIVPFGSQTIDGASSQVIVGQYDSLTIQSNGAVWYIL